MDASDRSSDALGGEALSDEARLCLGLSMDIDEARRAVLELAAARAYPPGALREWRSPKPESPAEMDRPPLFYAALGPRDDEDDMPLGLGASPADALADLLWTLAGPSLRAALAESETAEPERDPLAPDGTRNPPARDLAARDLATPNADLAAANDVP